MTMFQVTAVVPATVTILVAPFFIAVAALLYAFAVRRPPSAGCSGSASAASEP